MVIIGFVSEMDLHYNKLTFALRLTNLITIYGIDSEPSASNITTEITIRYDIYNLTLFQKRLGISIATCCFEKGE